MEALTAGEKVFRLLRQEHLIGDELLPKEHAGHVMVKVTCPDDRTIYASTKFARQIHQCSVLPVPFFGGAARLSRHCLGQETQVRRVFVDEVRYGMEKRGARCLNLEVHGEECAKCGDLEISVAQRIWLCVDARTSIKQEIHHYRWCNSEDVGVFCTYHRRVIEGEQERQLTYPIDHKHPLFLHITVPMVMSATDEEFYNHVVSVIAELRRRELERQRELAGAAA